MKCPKCNAVISNENINIQTDIARCIVCNYIFNISEAVASDDSFFDLNNTPSGAWIDREFNQITVGATTISPIAFFLVPFMLVWSAGSIGGIYGSQIISGVFDPFMCLFGIPFIIGSVIFWTLALMAIWGKIEIVLTNDGGEIFTGIGNVGIKKRFLWKEVSSITEEKSNLSYPGSKSGLILIKGKNRIEFGRGLNTERSYYILKSLQKIKIQIAKGGRL
jgi:hypothetical protein